MTLPPQPPRPSSSPTNAGAGLPAAADGRGRTRRFRDAPASGKSGPSRTPSPAVYGLTTDGAG
ncbi:MAG: hypothetical protein ACK53L_18405, partial [Pirellulaceae bacterium]